MWVNPDKHRVRTQQIRDVEPVLFYCWHNVADVVPALKQHSIKSPVALHRRGQNTRLLILVETFLGMTYELVDIVKNKIKKYSNFVMFCIRTIRNSNVWRSLIQNILVIYRV